MAKKRKASPKASPKKSPVHDTSAASQRARLLAHMREHGSVNTFEAIRLLNILRPGSRVAELRKQGHAIKTHRGTLTDDHGREHPRVATYYLTVPE